SACGPTTPVCGVDDRCHGCAADADCASLTCLPDGSCASVLDVLYASATGTSTATCMPNDHCSLPRAISLIDGTKSTIRLDPGRYAVLDALTLPTDLHLVGRGAVLDRDSAGTGMVVAIPDSTLITLDYLTIQGGDGATGHGVRCSNATVTMREVTVQGNAGSGIQSTGCALTISHAQIASNQGTGISVIGGSLGLVRSVVLANQGGGVSLTAARYDLENDVIAKNGGPSSLLGGVQVSQVLATELPADHVFQFNTVAQNLATLGFVPGVVCSGVAASLPMADSIVFDNGSGTQVDGAGCVWTYSDIGPVAPPGAGAHNLSSAPRFIDPIHNDFHLQVTSPARDAADPAAALAIDVDGDARPQGAGRDMGADEIK
ncbi:MAG TPA: right-handed parallel beta-helix repeat-containing protein, partial [Kofleriaceae bacterium]|nr:right-handed parallel beta-helix repeat-containing protein [Kofleriaceae bacterium]